MGKPEQRRGPPSVIPAPELGRYRDAVAELLIDVSAHGRPTDRQVVASMVDERSRGSELSAVLERTPDGADRTRTRLLGEIDRYQPNERSSAQDLLALVRIFLLSQIDAVWWGAEPAFERDEDVQSSPRLVDLEPLRRSGTLRFTYRRQPKGRPGRVRDAAMRRAQPNGRPKTAGVRFTRVRPEVVAMLDDLATSFDLLAPPGTPPLWVTSMTRSVQHQRRLQDLGYAALIPSAHCVGYAVDIEMAWFESHDASEALATVLLEQQHRGVINVIDEGQAWHACISPAATADLSAAYSRLTDR